MDDDNHDRRYEDGESVPEYADDRILIDTDELQRRLAAARDDGYSAGWDDAARFYRDLRSSDALIRSLSPAT